MAFIKKRREEKIEDIKEVVGAKEPEKVEPKKAIETVPLFVKIDKYRSVLSILNDLKTTIFLVKSALSVQKQIESLVDENRNLIENALNKIDEKTQLLDLEFTKPRGYTERMPTPSLEEEKSLENVVSDLKKQIDDLKSELKSIV